MKKIVLLLFMASSTMVFGAKPYYILNMIKVSDTGKEQIDVYQTELEAIAKNYNGFFLLPGLNTEEELIYDNSTGPYRIWRLIGNEFEECEENIINEKYHKVNY